MRIEIKRVTDWSRVLDACRMTVNKKFVGKEPSDKFKTGLCRSEHSPLRLMEYDITFYDIPYWVHVELVRHHIGVEKFVTTSRPDRTHSGLTRHELPQDAPVSMTLTMNAQALINVSKVRLCRQAAKETREIWEAVIEELRKVEPVLARFCVPSCIYRGGCPEFKPCGWSETSEYVNERMKYWLDEK